MLLGIPRNAIKCYQNNVKTKVYFNVRMHVHYLYTKISKEEYNRIKDARIKTQSVFMQITSVTENAKQMSLAQTISIDLIVLPWHVLKCYRI